jgi:hypothetical protein
VGSFLRGRSIARSSLKITPSGMSMLRLPASKADAGALTRSRPHRMDELFRRCSRWTSRPSLLVTLPASPRQTVQLERLGITVKMWTRCACRQLAARTKGPRSMRAASPSSLSVGRGRRAAGLGGRGDRNTAQASDRPLLLLSVEPHPYSRRAGTVLKAKPPSLSLGVRSERLAEIRDRMSRPGTATTASICLRALRFFRRGAEGHRQLVTAWVENRILTASLYPDGGLAPFALRYSLPWRHVNHLKTAVCSQSDGSVALCR